MTVAKASPTQTIAAIPSRHLRRLACSVACSPRSERNLVVGWPPPGACGSPLPPAAATG